MYVSWLQPHLQVLVIYWNRHGQLKLKLLTHLKLFTTDTVTVLTVLILSVHVDSNG
jgi:hypothetical protein